MAGTLGTSWRWLSTSCEARFALTATARLTTRLRPSWRPIDTAVQAFTDLLNRALDKPKEQEREIELTGSDD